MIKFNKKSSKEYIEVIPIDYNIYEFLHNINQYKHFKLFDIINKTNDKEIQKFIHEHPLIDNIINNRNNITIKRTVLSIKSICEFGEIEKFTCVGNKPLYFFKATFLHEEYDAIYLTYENIYNIFNISE